jgi:hypothetical protein
MRRPRLLIGLLLLATVLVAALALAVRPGMDVPHPSVRYDYDPGEGAEEVFIPAATSEYFGAVVWGLYLSQVSLAAIWLALGLRALPLRFIAVFSIVLVWNTVIFRLTNQSEDFSFGMVFTGMTAVVVAVPLLAARQFGLRLAHWRDGSLREIEPSGAERWQFSLLYLFGLMTVLAVFLGMLKFIFIYDVVWASLRQQLADATTNWRCQLSVAFHAIVAWAALWIALGNRRRPRVWLAMAITFSFLAVCLGISMCLVRYGDLSFRGHYNSSPPWYFTGSFWWHSGWCDFLADPWLDIFLLTALFALEALLLLGSLWAFRLVGYRVVFRRTRAAAPEPQTAVEEGGEKP